MLVKIKKNIIVSKIVIITFLNKIDIKTGCLRVVPKSHFLPNMPDSKKENSNAINLEIDKGDIILFSSQLHHATHQTHQKYNPRWTYLLTYRSWWCKQQFDFCKMIDPNIFSNLRLFIFCNSILVV